MAIYDLARAREAVQYLVTTSYGPQHIAKIRRCATKQLPPSFDGDKEVLNELIVIGHQSLPALEALLAIVRAKRSTKDDYQREFMANKRRRDNKILLLENLLAGAPVAREDRVLIISKQYVIWDKEHKAYLSKKGKLSWEERNTATREFWRTKEEELDALIKEAQNAAKPATKTRSQKR